MSYTRQTTIDQHRGEHSSGLHYFALTDIITDLSSAAEYPYDELTPEDREWWDRVLDDVHATEVEIALLDADERHEVEEAMLEGGGCDDVEETATYLRNIMTYVLADRHH